jgi:phage terminase large subunit GpA-like protein
MDETASRRHDTVCFTGPARTGKTMALILGRWIFSVVCHPLDFAVIHSAQDLARDFSRRDLDRQHNWSPALREQMTQRAKDYNTYDKIYRNGIMAVIGWPSKQQLASRTIPVMLLTDYCKWELAGFEQARKRTQTAGSLAMTVVEGSPGEWVSPDADIDKPVYELGKPLSHAFPATHSGPYASIIPIYQGGTREWWYVPCHACGEYYPQEGRIERFSWGPEADPILAARTAGTVCCWCGTVHGEETKQLENANGRWLAEGQVIDCNGKVLGDSRIGHTYPSFALGGGAAAYQTRKSIVQKYLQALENAKTTGDEKLLKDAVNEDIGAPFLSLHGGASREASPLKKRAESVKKKEVPEDVRFMIAAVDVQGDRFVVQVHGYGLDRNRWVPIDRYNMRHGPRGENTIQPAAYDEDWDELKKLIVRSYPLYDGSGRRMMIAGVLCDSGGVEGVAEKAYAFYRRLEPHLRARFRLVKGEPNPKAPLIEERWPDTRGRKDRKGASRGDVPVYFLNTQRLKDRLDGDLSRNEPGPGYCHFPDWIGEWWYKELTREKKDEKGIWQGKSKNEAWDLIVYSEAGAIMGLPFWRRPSGIDLDQFWQNPPAWAQPWETNALVFEPANRDDTGVIEKYFLPKPTPKTIPNPGKFARKSI